MKHPIQLKTGKYQHYKGKYYKVISTARHSETLETFVVYQQLYGNFSLWIRPYDMFVEQLLIDGKTIQRFKFIAEE
ncbi:DUF1653 domain-containing protein [Aureispira anguillae]|uniref:DUF1653 domain-containing protein n=1 Tax=Aureispira anguillae TaxID=2864201 RepID=A0A916DT21_9BACT|nr:DUF1653 domain-containing protein [Aureispira anguillae]BDS11442.1 DUF1653 domain-containing protein [Aureispira anguillae]